MTTAQKSVQSEAVRAADRELLELAAKAAGFASWDWLAGDGVMNVYHADGTQETFDPLTDDGEALRLAVKLSLDVRFSGGEVSVILPAPTQAKEPTLYTRRAEATAGDPYAATRRAIVRAAAEIGCAA
jgi:hypothetical protein